MVGKAAAHKGAGTLEFRGEPTTAEDQDHLLAPPGAEFESPITGGHRDPETCVRAQRGVLRALKRLMGHL